MNYAEKQNNANYHYKKQDNTYFFEGEEHDQIEIPIRFLSLFKSCFSQAKVKTNGDNFIVVSKN